MRGDIRSEEHPPVVYISNVIRGIFFDLRHAKLNLFTNSRFPVLKEVRPAERARQKLPPGAMFPRVDHSKDAGFGKIG